MAYSFIFNYNSKKNEMVGVTKTGHLIYVITPAQELSVLIFATNFFFSKPQNRKGFAKLATSRKRSWKTCWYDLKSIKHAGKQRLLSTMTSSHLLLHNKNRLERKSIADVSAKAKLAIKCSRSVKNNIVSTLAPLSVFFISDHKLSLTVTFSIIQELYLLHISLKLFSISLSSPSKR